MRLKLLDLQGDDNQVEKLRVIEFPERWEDIEVML